MLSLFSAYTNLLSLGKEDDKAIECVLSTSTCYLTNISLGSLATGSVIMLRRRGTVLEHAQ